MKFRITTLAADGRVLEKTPGKIPAGCIGAVVEGPTGEFTAVPVIEESTAVDGNLGVYPTFELAAEALHSNHRQEWTREERRRAAGGW